MLEIIANIITIIIIQIARLNIAFINSQVRTKGKKHNFKKSIILTPMVNGDYSGIVMTPAHCVNQSAGGFYIMYYDNIK